MAFTKTKEEGMELVAATAEKQAWLRKANGVAKDLHASVQVPIDVRDLERICPVPPHFDNRILGRVFNTKEWRCVGTRIYKGYSKRHKGHMCETICKLWEPKDDDED